MTRDDTRYWATSYAFWLLAQGIPYRWAGESNQGMDCSGLAQEMLRSVGLDPPGDQSAKALCRAFQGYQVDHPTSGCLTFYGSSVDSISHVGIAINSELMIEAGGGGRRTTSEEAAHKAKAFVRIRPIDRKSNLIAIIDPFLSIPD